MTIEREEAIILLNIASYPRKNAKISWESLKSTKICKYLKVYYTKLGIEKNISQYKILGLNKFSLCCLQVAFGHITLDSNLFICGLWIVNVCQVKERISKMRCIFFILAPFISRKKNQHYKQQKHMCRLWIWSRSWTYFL